jgi:hypothetical protein
VSRTPATVTQADVARIIRAAKQAGANRVDVAVNGQVITVHLSPSTAPETEANPKRESVL